ncbi:hypothetical protein Dda_4689 [Drechslerella dactyloides]|uniref:Uncharacterized protein n=1 Tax=Drechslerella dactyloides TaxID=74499 RepID=A0AAD6IXD9_DREDA|nr:hypothetical protein Dda_4689 [Drechslerella dactyloides]
MDGKATGQPCDELRKYIDQLASASTRIQNLVGKFDDYVEKHNFTDIDGEMGAMLVGQRTCSIASSETDNTIEKLVEKLASDLKAKDAEIEALRKELETLKKENSKAASETNSGNGQQRIVESVWDHLRGPWASTQSNVDRRHPWTQSRTILDPFKNQSRTISDPFKTQSPTILDPFKTQSLTILDPWKTIA